MVVACFRGSVRGNFSQRHSGTEVEENHRNGYFPGTNDEFPGGSNEVGGNVGCGVGLAGAGWLLAG